MTKTSFSSVISTNSVMQQGNTCHAFTWSDSESEM